MIYNWLEYSVECDTYFATHAAFLPHGMVASILDQGQYYCD